MKYLTTPKKILAAVALLTLIVMSHFSIAFAQVTCPAVDPKNPYPVCVGDLPHADASQSKIQEVLNIVFALVGIMSLLAMVIGGFRYITSQGDPQAVSKAKSTIIYGIVGLLVAISAVTIVAFVIGRV